MIFYFVGYYCCHSQPSGNNRCKGKAQDICRIIIEQLLDVKMRAKDQMKIAVFRKPDTDGGGDDT